MTALEDTDRVAFWIETEEIIEQYWYWIHGEEKHADIGRAFVAWRHARNESVDRETRSLINTFIRRV